VSVKLVTFRVLAPTATAVVLLPLEAVFWTVNVPTVAFATSTVSVTAPPDTLMVSAEVGVGESALQFVFVVTV
jgi:hypothetical protein